MTFIDSIRQTDDLITLKELQSFPQVPTDLMEAVRDTCYALWGDNFSLFLTGSLALCLRANSLDEFRFSGDKSDVDLWIIVSNVTPNPQSQTLKDLEKKLVKGLSRLSAFDVTCVPFKDKTHKISLKLMTTNAVTDVLSFKSKKLRVYRYNSLRQVKEEDVFHGVKKSYSIQISEKELEGGGFLWLWNTNCFMQSEFVLTDIHSCFLIGGFISDHLNLKSSRDDFLNALPRYVQTITEERGGSATQILKYFYERFPSSAQKVFEK